MSPATTVPDRSSEPDADAVVEAVLACPAVAAMSAGIAGEVATYLPGRRVGGVRVDGAAVEVHVVVRYGPTMTEVGDQVRRAVAPLASGRAVRVVIDDIDLDDAGTAPPPNATPETSVAVPAATAPAGLPGTLPTSVD